MVHVAVRGVSCCTREEKHRSVYTPPHSLLTAVSELSQSIVP